jgi:hypothetical protein
MAQPAFDWFSLVTDDSIQQGDFFFDCPVIVSTSKITGEAELIIDAQVAGYDVVVMSQSCDLEHDKLESVMVCPTWVLSEVAKVEKRFLNPKECEAVRRGNVPGFHMLNACEVEGFVSLEVRLVGFRQIFSVPLDYLRQRAKDRPRLRLLPPYREQLAQAFARYFMRVGLPVDIPPFR